MADTETTPKESGLTDNPTAWFEKKDAERTEKTDAPGEDAKVSKPASPAEPTVAEPKAEPQPPSWKDIVIGDDVDHGFFRGKKVPQVIESYRFAEKAKQDAERRAAELERQLAQAQQAQRPPEPSGDPEINRLWFENPEAAYKKVQEQAAATAAQVADARFQENWATQTRNQQIADTFEQGSRAYEAAQRELNVAPEMWKLRSPLVLLHLTNPDSPYYGDGHGIKRSADMVNTYKALFGDPQPVVVAKPAPEPPPPPGAKKPAVTAPSADHTSPLSREASRAAKTFAENFGLDPERFAARFAQNKEKTNG